MSQKMRLIALAALSLASAASMAQTNVNLYGIVDAAVRMDTNQGQGLAYGDVKSVAAGGMSQSRLGINVGEDLGGGYRALVNLEHRLMSDTGAQSSAADFWRQAWVGLVTPVGRITLGRQYNILFDLTTSTFAAYKYSPYIEQFKPELGVSMGNRQSNMVKYAMTLGDFTAEAQVSAGENTGDKTYGAMARYQMGGFAFGAGMINAKAPSGKQIKGTVFGGSYTSGPLYVNLGYGKNKFDALAASATPFGLAPNTTADPAYTALIAAYSTALVSPATPVTSILNAAAIDVKDRDLWSVGFTYNLTSQFNIGAQYYKMKQSHNYLGKGASSKANLMSVVGDYALSKRTDVYVEFDRISIDGDSPTVFQAGCTATAAQGGSAFNQSGCKRDRTGYMAGVRHRF